jgi:hypothetical protein
MRKLLAISVMVITLATAVRTGAQELLINGDLNNPGTNASNTSVGWTLTEGPLNLATPPVLVNSAQFQTFAERTAGANRVGLWLQPFAGNPASTTAPPTVFAHLTQDVAGAPGLVYSLSAWSRFETHYAGGVDNLNDGAPEATGESSTDGAASPTDTFLAIDFLDLLNNVIGTSSIELRADGQSNNAGWRQHLVSGVSPVGTVTVRARGSMIDGQLNPGVNPQSAFLDDFSLTARPVPEPHAAALGALGLLGWVMIRRRL